MSSSPAARRLGGGFGEDRYSRESSSSRRHPSKRRHRRSAAAYSEEHRRYEYYSPSPPPPRPRRYHQHDRSRSRNRGGDYPPPDLPYHHRPQHRYPPQPDDERHYHRRDYDEYYAPSQQQPLRPHSPADDRRRDRHRHYGADYFPPPQDPLQPPPPPYEHRRRSRSPPPPPHHRRSDRRRRPLSSSYSYSSEEEDRRRRHRHHDDGNHKHRRRERAGDRRSDHQHYHQYHHRSPPAEHNQEEGNDRRVISVDEEEESRATTTAPPGRETSGHHRRRQSYENNRSPPPPLPPQPNHHHHGHEETCASTPPDDSVGHYKGEPGQVIEDRYRILRDVGLGTFGRVVECLDLVATPKAHKDNNETDGHITGHSRQRRRRDGGRNETDKTATTTNHHRTQKQDVVAIKIVRKVARYYDSAAVEAKMIDDVNRRGGRGLSHCVVLHNHFSFQGHYCMVFERLGPSLFDFLKKHNYQPFPMACIQDFAIQLLETLEFLHGFGMIHTDLKIENILLTSDREISFDRHGTTKVPERTKIKLIDFGGACYDDSKKSTIVNTRQYRAPEVILETGWSMPSDIWGAGCILVELYQGELLFPTHSNLEHLALMEHVIGPFPHRMLQNAKATDLVTEAFDRHGRHRRARILSTDHEAFVRQSPTLNQILTRPSSLDPPPSSYSSSAAAASSDRYWFSRLLHQMLVIDPRVRSTAHECLLDLARMRRREVRYA